MGCIELQCHSTDQLVIDITFHTISRGRSDFDVERFTARRRSSSGKDNANCSIQDAGAVVSAIPLSGDDQLAGPEFLESTLPSAALAAVQGPYAVNDNRRVTILNEAKEAEVLDGISLAALAGKVSFAGSGGGFLSNEISYRTHLLHERSGRAIPVGHLHVPKPESSTDRIHSKRIEPSDRQVNQAIIVAQVKELVKAALDNL